MEKDCYSPLKVFHHRDRLDALRQGDCPAPVHLQLVPTNRCNQFCKFCAYRNNGYGLVDNFNPKDHIAEDKLIQLAEDCKLLGIRAVEITGGGEPLCHQGLARLCKKFVELNVDYSVVSNGSIDGDTDIFLKAKWVRFSLDSGGAQNYANLRRSTSEVFGRVRKLINNLSKAKDRPIIGVGFVITAENWKDVLLAAKNAKEDGADNIRISAVFQSWGVDYFKSFFEQAQELCRTAKILYSDDNFEVFNLFSDRVGDLGQQSRCCEKCHIQHLVTYLGADLNLYRCCTLAYSSLGLLGSFKDRSLYDLWNDPKTQFKLKNFNTEQCSRCMANNKNRVISYALETNPIHVNFL